MALLVDLARTLRTSDVEFESRQGLYGLDSTDVLL